MTMGTTILNIYSNNSHCFSEVIWCWLIPFLLVLHKISNTITVQTPWLHTTVREYIKIPLFFRHLVSAPKEWKVGLTFWATRYTWAKEIESSAVPSMYVVHKGLYLLLFIILTTSLTVILLKAVIIIIIIIIRPHRLHALHICGLLLHMSHVARSACPCAYTVMSSLSYAKMAKMIEMPFGGWLMWVKGTVSYIRVRIPHKKGHFWGGYVPTHGNVPTHDCIASVAGECACPAHAVDEHIRSLYQITSATYLQLCVSGQLRDYAWSMCQATCGWSCSRRDGGTPRDGDWTTVDGWPRRWSGPSTSDHGQ